MDTDNKNTEQPDIITQLADELKNAFELVSPFIEKHTSIVCAECKNVCCMDRHGRYDESDILFLRALDVDVSFKCHEKEETAPCRYLDEKGCSLSRWLRPYRCTFFFCNPLLKSLESDNSKLYSTFKEYFNHMDSVRSRLLAQNRDKTFP